MSWTGWTIFDPEEGALSYCPLDQVESFLRRFVVYPSEHALKVHTLWIAHCHLMDLWERTPRLAFMSPEPESGKTRALEVTALFVPTPRLSFSMSAASLVRIIAKGHETGAIPTILFDEIDNLFSKSRRGLATFVARSMPAIAAAPLRLAASIRVTALPTSFASARSLWPGCGLYPTPWQPGPSSFICGHARTMRRRRASGFGITRAKRSRSSTG